MKDGISRVCLILNYGARGYENCRSVGFRSNGLLVVATALCHRKHGSKPIGASLRRQSAVATGRSLLIRGSFRHSSHPNGHVTSNGRSAKQTAAFGGRAYSRGQQPFPGRG